MKLSLSVIALSLAMSSALATADEERRELTLPTSGLSTLNASTGAGKFVLETSADSSSIEVVAMVYNPTDKAPELTLEKRGDTAYLVAKFPDSVSKFGKSPYIDLTVKVPASFNLSLTDGSGDIEISGLDGDIKLTDGSGDLRIQGGNRVTINDGSGGIWLSQTQGDVKITDGSGDMQVSDIQGNVSIKDGSGDIEVSQVQEQVEITDGSGDIEVNDAGRLLLHSTGSGQVTSKNIREGVTLP